MSITDYINCDGTGLAELIKSGKIASNEVLAIVYQLIDLLNEPLNAVVSVEKTQAERASRQLDVNVPLPGVPIAMKDCVGYVSGVPRNFGSRLAYGTAIDFDSDVVKRYKSAGMIPVATTNVPEFSSSITTESKLYGPCRNPWDLSRSSGGSGGGGAALVAAGIVPIAYGNDSLGSIRIPASCNGIFGMKPSRGRVPTGPNDGEIWYGLFTNHVITRSVRDSALMLDIGEGIGCGALYGAPSKRRRYVEEVSTPPGRLKIAVYDGGKQGVTLHPDCRAALDSTVTLLSNLGHEVVNGSIDFSAEQLYRNIEIMLAVALADELPSIAQYSQRPITAEFVERCHLALYQRGLNTSAVALTQALQYRAQLARSLGLFMNDYDILLTPTLAEPPIQLGVLDADSEDLDAYLNRMWTYSPFTPIANITGVPSMSVPLSWTKDGLPIGMMFTARYAGEDVLFRLAGQLENACPWHKRHPPFSPWCF